MAKSNGKVDTEKIIAILEKASIEEIIVAYMELKSWVTKKILTHTEALGEEQNKFLEIKDKI